MFSKCFQYFPFYRGIMRNLYAFKWHMMALEGHRENTGKLWEVNRNFPRFQKYPKHSQTFPNIPKQSQESSRHPTKKSAK